MSSEVSYTAARSQFASLCDRVTEDREVVVIHRRGAQDVALIAADELGSLLETAHLLRSPRNAERLLRALNRAWRGGGKPSSLRRLTQEVGIEERSADP